MSSAQGYSHIDWARCERFRLLHVGMAGSGKQPRLCVRGRLVGVQVEAIQFLVQAGCPANVQDSVASTPVHIAAGEGHIEAIRVLKSLVRALNTATAAPLHDTP